MKPRPRIYTASKVFRALMWRELRSIYPALEFTSRWIDQKVLDDSDDKACREGWVKNIEDVVRSQYLLCYGSKHDPEPLSGTLVEIGAALAVDCKVYLIGNYDWRTWRHHPSIKVVPSLPILSATHLCAAVLDRIQRGTE